MISPERHSPVAWPRFASHLQSTRIRCSSLQRHSGQSLLLLRLRRWRDILGFDCAELDFPSRCFPTTGLSLELAGRMFLVRVRPHSLQSLRRRPSLFWTNTMNRFSKSKHPRGMPEMYWLNEQDERASRVSWSVQHHLSRPSMRDDWLHNRVVPCERVGRWWISLTGVTNHRVQAYLANAWSTRCVVTAEWCAS